MKLAYIYIDIIYYILSHNSQRLNLFSVEFLIYILREAPIIYRLIDAFIYIVQCTYIQIYAY